MNLPLLTQMLSNQTGRPVVDRTGLTGNFDVELHWSLASWAQRSPLSYAWRATDLRAVQAKVVHRTAFRTCTAAPGNSPNGARSADPTGCRWCHRSDRRRATCAGP